MRFSQRRCWAYARSWTVRHVMCVCVMVILSGAVSFRGITRQVPAREEGGEEAFF